MCRENGKVYVSRKIPWRTGHVHRLQHEIKEPASKLRRKGGVKTFVNKKCLVSRTVMIRCALESPHLGQPFKYLGHHHITHRKFFRATWIWKMPQKLTKTLKFWEPQLALKNKIWSLARFLKLSFTSLVLNVTIWCALDNFGLGQPFKYLERYDITRKKVFRAT